MFDEHNQSVCPICKKTVYNKDMERTHDCQGIPYRLVCGDCYYNIMECEHGDGYDGQYYDERDENISEDW